MEIAKVRNETEGFKDGEGRVVKNSIAEQDDPVPAWRLHLYSWAVGDKL